MQRMVLQWTKKHGGGNAKSGSSVQNGKIKGNRNSENNQGVVQLILHIFSVSTLCVLSFLS